MLKIKTENLIRPALTTLGYELWGVEVHNHSGGTLLRIYIDFPFESQEADETKCRYISSDDCARASQEISTILDLEDPIKGRYTLEVSSPGENRTLFNLEQYEHFIGKKVNIKLFSKDQNGKKKYIGHINAIIKDKNSIAITADEKNIEIPIANIEKAYLLNS